MTGTECFRAALNILSETPDSGVYYEQFALGALNQLLANSLREMNAERASDGKDGADRGAARRRLAGARMFSVRTGGAACRG